MANVEARLKIKGKEYEIFVDVDKAIQLKNGEEVSMGEVLAIDDVFYDYKKGLKASSSDLNDAFGTDDVKEVAKKIILQGEVVLPSEYKNKEQGEKVKQVINFLSKNAVDPATGNPHSEKRIGDAIKQAKINIKNAPIEQQLKDIVSELSKILPLKIETKKLKVIIPASQTGKAYSVIKEYKEKEEWLPNGDLSCIISLPIGLQMEFYDKLNGVTHGSAIVEEIKE
jgi:ribosome maturation protein SDO1